MPRVAGMSGVAGVFRVANVRHRGMSLVGHMAVSSLAWGIVTLVVAMAFMGSVCLIHVRPPAGGAGPAPPSRYPPRSGGSYPNSFFAISATCLP